MRLCTNSETYCELRLVIRRSAVGRTVSESSGILAEIKFETYNGAYLLLYILTAFPTGCSELSNISWVLEQCPIVILFRVLDDVVLQIGSW